MRTFLELREFCSTRPDCKMVSAQEFIDLMMSHAEFERADEPEANLLGLIDRVTGGRVFVRAEEIDVLRGSFLHLN
ncbi:hypothetical protein KOR42_38140 [Thalassoglobus neptunius]|uniref:Uncharacterized protein n=1 Tax=Thalassoglobus neptunius TaxID=1938619 RepID=A0A5C5WJ50_9PLAN|nr:hypothetical protein KOR42_38140 [Thalassoglobus neptunius]